MRSKSSVGVLAVMLAVAAIGPGTTFAQTPVVPAPTVPAQPADQSKGEGPTVKVPKVEKPTVEVPKVEKPTVEVPKVEKPVVKAPKPETPTVKAPKPETPTVKAPKPEKVAKPRDEKPAPDTATPAQPSPEPSEPVHPEPAAPERGQAGAPRAEPDGPGPKPDVDVAKPVPPRRKSAPAVPVSGVQPVTRARGGAADENGQVIRRLASHPGPEPSGTSSAGSSGASADAAPAAGAPAAATRRRAPQLGTDGVAGAAAAASLDPRQPRVLIVSDRGGYNLLPLLLAMVLAAGVGYLFGRQVMHDLGLAARRPAPTRRGARPGPAARGREGVDRHQFRERLLRTSARRPRARRRVPRRQPFLGRAGTAVAQFLWPSVRPKSSRRRRAGTQNGFRTPSPVRPSR